MMRSSNPLRHDYGIASSSSQSPLSSPSTTRSYSSPLLANSSFSSLDYFSPASSPTSLWSTASSSYPISTVEGYDKGVDHLTSSPSSSRLSCSSKVDTLRQRPPSIKMVSNRRTILLPQAQTINYSRPLASQCSPPPSRALGRERAVSKQLPLYLLELDREFYLPLLPPTRLPQVCVSEARADGSQNQYSDCRLSDNAE